LTDLFPADEFVPRGVGGLILQGPSSIPADELAALADDMGMSLSSAGINLNLAPVVNIVPEGSEDANAPIGAWDRQYGSTAQAVTAAAGTFADGLAAHGVTPR
jgi:beta-glucosidase-like glycosyl hydrolase